MKSIFLFIILFLLTFSGLLNAQTLKDLEWMSGYWTLSQNGNTMEELWTPASGGLMLGLHRDVFSNGRMSFEYLRIAESSEGIVYLASPGGQAPTSFSMTEVMRNKVVFENLGHDFPQRIIYSLNGDKLTARIEDASGDNGMEWTWTKTKFNE